MDKKPATGVRNHFRFAGLTTTPTLMVMGGERQAVVFVNEGTTAIRIGHSGTVASRGLYIAGGSSFSDNYSSDEYWGVVSAGSGTVSGFVVP